MINPILPNSLNKNGRPIFKNIRTLRTKHLLILLQIILPRDWSNVHIQLIGPRDICFSPEILFNSYGRILSCFLVDLS